MNRQSCFNTDHHDPHTRSELEEDVREYVAEVERELGVILDFEAVWNDLQLRMIDHA